MDLASLIESFSVASGYQITRKARGGMLKGRVATGTISTLVCNAAIYPPSMDKLMKLPQGRQFNETVVVVTTTELKAGGVDSAYEADQISIGPSRYEVSEQEIWLDPSSGNTAYRALVTLVTP